MSDALNTIDALLQATSPRLLPVTIDGGLLLPGTVTTGAIANNAVTTVVEANNTTGSFLVQSPLLTWTSIQQVSITNSDVVSRQCLLTAVIKAEANGVTAATYVGSEFTIYDNTNSTYLMIFPGPAAYTGKYNPGTITLSQVVTIPAGATYPFDIEGRQTTDVNGTIYVSNARIRAELIKK